jgi:hypothetical protein
MKIAAAVVVAVVLAASGPALAPNSATGTFESKAIKFDLGGAIAFNAPSILDESQPAIFVAVSNRPLVPTLGDYIDRRRAIETLVKNDSTAIVYFLFTPQGRFRGVSYYFEPGNGCGFCSSAPASPARCVWGNHRAGHWLDQTEGPDFVS